MINETKMRIPKKYQPMIKEIHRESDGVWVTLNDGFKSTNTDSHTIHETNQADAMEQIRYTIVEWDDDPEIEKTKQQIIDAAPEGAVKQVTCLGGLYNIILNKGYIFKLTGKDMHVSENGAGAKAYAREIIKADTPTKNAYGIESRVSDKESEITIDGFHRIAVYDAMTRYNGQQFKRMTKYCEYKGSIPYELFNNMSTTFDFSNKKAFTANFTTTALYINDTPLYLFDWHCLVNEKTNVIIFFQVLGNTEVGLYAYKICPPEEREIFQWGKHVQLWEGIAEELEKMDDTRLFYSEKVKEKLQRALNGGYAVSGNCFACDFARRNDNALCQSCPLTDMRSCSTGSPFSWFGSFLSHNNKPAAVATALDISRKEPKNGVWVRDIDDNIYLYFGGKNND